MTYNGFDREWLNSSGQSIRNYGTSLGRKGGSYSGTSRFIMVVIPVLLVVVISGFRSMIRNYLKSKEFTLIIKANKNIYRLSILPNTFSSFNTITRIFYSLEAVMNRYKFLIQVASSQPEQDKKPKSLKIKNLNLDSETREGFEKIDNEFVQDLKGGGMTIEEFFSLTIKKRKNPTLQFEFLKDGSDIKHDFDLSNYVSKLKHHLGGFLLRFKQFSLTHNIDKSDIEGFIGLIYLSLPFLLPQERVRASDAFSVNGIRNWDCMLKDIEHMPSSKDRIPLFIYNLPSKSKNEYKESYLNPQGITILRSLMDTYQNALKGRRISITNYYWIDNELLREGIDLKESEQDKLERERWIERYIDNMRDIRSNRKLFEFIEDQENPLILKFHYVGNPGSREDIHGGMKHLNLIMDGYRRGTHPNSVPNEENKTARDYNYEYMTSIYNQINDDFQRIIEANDDDSVLNIDE